MAVGASRRCGEGPRQVLPVPHSRWISSGRALPTNNRMCGTRRPRGSERGKDRKETQKIAKDLGVGLLGVSVAGERQRKVMHAKALRREGAVLVTDRYPQTQIRGFYDGPRIVRKASATWIRDHFAKVEDAR